MGSDREGTTVSGQPPSYRVGANLNRLADKLLKAAEATQRGGAVTNVVTVTTLLAEENIVERVTGDIRTHSGLSRKRNPQPAVNDLVDTGAYRASWTTEFPSPYKGVLSTNSEYAAVLEYGRKDGSMKGFFPARETAKKMSKVFKRKMELAIRDIYK